MGYQYFLCFFFKYTQNNFESLKLGMIHLVIQIHSMLVQIFYIYHYCMSFLFSSMYSKC